MPESTKRFRVALSFAGERRPFVELVAARLASQLGQPRVLYDAYYEAEFARVDLDTYLQRLYHDESELIAIFLSADYERKEWCGLEWRAIRDLIKKRKGDSVMPLRFDATEIPGLFSGDGYVSIRDRTPDVIAVLILEAPRNRQARSASVPTAPGRTRPYRVDPAGVGRPLDLARETRLLAGAGGDYRRRRRQVSPPQTHRRGTGEDPRPWGRIVNDAEQTWRAKLTLLEIEEAKAVDPALKFKIAEDIKEVNAKLAGFAAASTLASVPQRVAPTRLRHAADRLFGREAELAALDAAWGDRAVHVVTLVAWGGTGKTALVARWAAALAARDYDGADFFDWSFYSQGAREEGGASADPFVDAALRFFGDEATADSALAPWDKGARLAQLVAGRRTLLVLDGLEPLQHPPGPLAGELKDPGVTALLKGLAGRNAGLCVVTTRERVRDLAAFEESTVPLPGAGAALDARGGRAARLARRPRAGGRPRAPGRGRPRPRPDPDPPRRLPPRALTAATCAGATWWASRRPTRRSRAATPSG